MANTIGNFDLVNDFTRGYRNREDITNLPPGILVVGSQNVVTNTANRVGIVKGYTLDGQANSDLSGIISSYDWFTSKGKERNMRSYLDFSTGYAVLQYRYIDANLAVTWRNLITTSLSEISASFNFTEYWNNTELLNTLLFVNGSTKVFEWNGAVTTFSSATANTITKEGSTSWAEEGFYISANKKIVINGTEYTYTGGESTTTLTGVTPDPTLGGYSTGEPIHQQYYTTNASGITSLPSTMKIDLISTTRNQVYYGSLTLSSVYISAVNNYKSVAYTSPTRVVGEGALITLDSPPVAFVPQEDAMYISSGKDSWFNTYWTLSSDLTKESFSIQKLKTGAKQAAYSQSLVTKDKNNVIFVTNEPVLTTLGRVSGVITTPMTNDISFPIINDFNTYDFTDGHAKYHKNFIYVTVPKAGVVRVYNQTRSDKQYWEAPITYPIGRLSVIGGELYGHSYNTPETYKLFDGYNFNGTAIPALAVFSFNNFGDRVRSKGFNQSYAEGYISANGVLTMGIQKDLEGCATPTQFDIDGDQQPPKVCVGGTSAPIGKESIGKNPLGGGLAESTMLPPKFRIIKTMPIEPYFYELQHTFYSNYVDFQWELLAFGVKIERATDLNTSIKD